MSQAVKPTEHTDRGTKVNERQTLYLFIYSYWSWNGNINGYSPTVEYENYSVIEDEAGYKYTKTHSRKIIQV